MEEAINTQFEYWITITFAVVVASFVAGRRLNRRLRFALALLYGLSTVVLVSRLGYNALDAADFREALLASGVTLRTPWVTIISRTTLFLLGTSAALVFLLSEKSLNEPDN
jgi:hypothetical protein